MIKFEYCPILGLRWYEFKEVKTKYLDNYYKKSNFIKTKKSNRLWKKY